MSLSIEYMPSISFFVVTDMVSGDDVLYYNASKQEMLDLFSTMSANRLNNWFNTIRDVTRVKFIPSMQFYQEIYHYYQKIYHSYAKSLKLTGTL